MSNNPFEAVAAAATGNSINTLNPARHSSASVSDEASLASSSTDLPSLGGEQQQLTQQPVQTVDISRHPSGIVPVLQYCFKFIF